MSFKRPPPREAKQWTGDALPSPRSAKSEQQKQYDRDDAKARRQREALRIDDGKARLSVPVPKTPDRKSQAIRDAARDEECTVRIVGACNFDPATSVWSHAPWLDGDRGMQIKSLDLNGAIACSACHDLIDGRTKHLPPGASKQSIELDWHRGHLRSLVRLRQKGLV